MFSARLGGTTPERDFYVHYNILRPGRQALEAGEEDAAYDFGRDSAWRDTLGLEARLRALIVVADRETLLARTRSRTDREPGSRRPYEPEPWLEVYGLVDVDALYAAWRRELDRHAIPWIDVEAPGA